MKFSLWNFKEWYSQCGIDLSYIINDNTASISMLASTPSAAEDRMGCAIIRPAEELTDCTGFHTVLQYGSDRILFPVASPAEVWNYGNAMIEQYTDWEDKLLACISSNESIDKLFTCAQEQFPFPFSLILLNGTVYRHSADCIRSFHTEDIHAILSAALKSPHYQPICRTFLFDRAQTFLAETILINQKPFAVLTAYENGRHLQPGHIPIFHALIETFQTYLRFHMQSMLAIHPLSNWYRQCISNDSRQSDPLPAQMSELGWAKTDYYQIASIYLHSGSSSSVLYELSTQLTAASHCCTMTDNSLSVLLHHGSSYPFGGSAALFSQNASAQYCVGLSLPFQGLYSLRDYKQQSVWAAQQASKSGEAIFEMSAHLSEYLLHLCQALPNAQSMIHPDILLLAEADISGNDELLKSLYTYYIYGQSISRTAEMLFIHRNTLRLRLNKIQSLLSVDLDETAVQQQYLLSLMLYPIPQ